MSTVSKSSHLHWGVRMQKHPLKTPFCCNWMIQVFAYLKRTLIKLIDFCLEMSQADLDDVMLPVKCLFLTYPFWS